MPWNSWGMQKYGKTPGLSNRWTNGQTGESLGSASPLAKLPSSVVTLWMPPVLIQVTVSPAWMISREGVKVNPPTATW